MTKQVDLTLYVSHEDLAQSIKNHLEGQYLGNESDTMLLRPDDPEIGTCDECHAPHENGANDHCTECGNCSEHCAQYVDCPDKED